LSLKPLMIANSMSALEPVRNFLESRESVVILCPRARRFAGAGHVDQEEP
jgi:hypothetical protein